MNIPRTCTITIEDSPHSDDVRAIQHGLEAFNRQYAPEDNYQPLTVFLRTADQTLIGGLLGETYWGWLHISILWLHESVRGQGYGQQLLHAAEQEAARRGRHHVHLDTLSFQALPFYEKHGYRVFGVLDDHPMGHRRYFLTKELSPPV